jgi:hypothetical protein
MATMARLQFGRLTEVWKGEAADFTSLLAEQLDAAGEATGVDLTSLDASGFRPPVGVASTSLPSAKMGPSSSSRTSTDALTMII